MIRKYIEKRVAAVVEERGYADLILAGLEARLTGGTSSALKTTALEHASGNVGRASWPARR